MDKLPVLDVAPAYPVNPLAPRRRSLLAALLPALPQSYGARVALGLVLFAAVWLGELGYVGLTPPMDNVEQLTWVRSLQLGYYKHPPLPTWLMWLVVKAVGLQPNGSYLLGASVTLAALGVLTALLVAMRGRTYASIALLAALCITYYNGRLHFYNHNTVLMFFVSTSAAACWLAFRRCHLGWWALLGLSLGLGGITKYQIAVTGFCVAVVWVQQRGWRDPVHRNGVVIAALLAILVMAPHLVWLMNNDFGPFHYAMSSSLGVSLAPTTRVASVGLWLVDQLLNRLLPAWLLLAVAITRAPTQVAPWIQSSQGTAPIAQAVDLDRALLWSFGFVPLLFMPAMGLAFGSELQSQWGTAFVAFTVPAVMEVWAWCRGRLEFRPLRAVTAFIVLQMVMLAINAYTSPKAPAGMQSHHWSRFPSAHLAHELRRPVRRALGGPVAVIDGPSAIAGALSLRMHERPLVLINGNAKISPWISEAVLQHCPRLVLRQGSLGTEHGWKLADVAFPGLYWRVQPALDPSMPCVPSSS